MTARLGPARDERGGVLVITLLSLVALLGMAALTIDVGNVLLQKRRLQAAVDSGVLAGSQKLPTDATAKADASGFTQANWSKYNADLPLSTSVTTGCQVAGCTANDKVSETASASVPMFFAKVLGIDSMQVSAKAAACGPCDTSVNKFDVMVVLDRSYSMCLDSSNRDNGCYDLQQAKDGIKSLLAFFNPATDRVGLAALSPGNRLDAKYPCDTSATSTTGGTFAGTLGDFMDKPGTDHPSVLVPLTGTFKKANGDLDDSSPLVSTLTCLQHKYWTPIAPAIQGATQELQANGRSDPKVKKIIVFLGDGGANVQPMVRDAKGNATTTPSWYTPTGGNNLRPCRDAIGQAGVAKAAGIDVYAIGYDLNASAANLCTRDNHPSDAAYDEGITAKATMQAMASDSQHFYEKATPGQLFDIFNSIGHQITTGGSRLVE